MLVAHAIVAYPFLVILGAMIPVHIPLGWNRRRNRLSGSVLVGLFALLSLTALGSITLGKMRSAPRPASSIGSSGSPPYQNLLVHVIRNRTR